MSEYSLIFTMKKKVMYIFLGILGMLVLFGFTYAKTSPQMGGKAQSFDSPNYQDGMFQNLVPTSLSSTSEEHSMLSSTYDFFFNKDENSFPKDSLPTLPFDKDSLADQAADDIILTWLGHSTALIHSNGTTILTDPVLQESRLPPLYMGPKPFPYEHTYSVKNLPKIDIVLISHDHYDHLDMKTVKELKDATFFVPLGIKAHLLRWDIAEENIYELDWYEERDFSENLKLILTPARHFSGRSFSQNTTLWGSWVIQIQDKNIYFGGDSGYFEEFKNIGKNYGPFDVAMLDVGQYDPAWQQIHMLPEEAVQASIDLNAKAMLPIHNSKYVLSLHSWFEPLERASTEAEKQEISITTPQIGETFLLSKNLPNKKWWTPDN